MTAAEELQPRHQLTPLMEAPTQLLRVFAEAERDGNPVAVTLWPGQPPAAATVAPAADALTRCHAWPTPTGVATLCQQRGHSIRFCGHGLLAIAWLWQQRYGSAPCLLTADLALATGATSSRAWLRLQRPATRDVPLPPSSAPFPRQGLIAAACSGDATGYRLLIYAPGTALAALGLDTAAISRYDGRALILSALTSQPPFDYHLRYTAPQYGNPEDRATGSAHAVAGSYWAQRLGSSALVGLQTPAPEHFPAEPRCGGVVHVGVWGESLTIGGELKVLDSL